jgi:putative RecB family exonuclease
MDQCPKRYEFRYRDKVDVGSTTSVEAFLGSRVHEALEQLYKDVARGRTPSADDVAATYQGAWNAEWSEEVSLPEGAEAREFRALGEVMVRRFVARRTPFDDGTTIGLEMKLDVPLDEVGAFKLFGYADRVVRVAEGRWEIHDYKTGSRLPPQSDLDSDRQLALYQMAVQQMYPDAVDVELVWHYLAFDMEVRSHRSVEQIEALRQETISRMRASEGCTDFPTRTGALCGWCEYRSLCPAFAHERDVADSDGDLSAVEGVALVDAYADLDARVKDLEREKSVVAERLVAFADANGYDALVGSTSQVKVWRKNDACTLPGWDDPRRDDIESILRDAGLWDRFASLATVTLSKALEEGTLPPDVAERIMQHVTLEPRVRLYVRARSRGYSR